MKVSELTGDDLALWAGRAAGYEYATDPKRLYEVYSTGRLVLARDSDGDLTVYGKELPGDDGYAPWRPHEDWAQGGPIIERERIELTEFEEEGDLWSARRGDSREFGATALIAAMRAYISSKFGDEVPQEPQ